MKEVQHFDASEPMSPNSVLSDDSNATQKLSFTKEKNPENIH